MRLTMTIALIGLICTAGFPGSSMGSSGEDNLPSAEEVIRHYIEAVGGRETIEGLFTRTCIGRIVEDLSWKSPQHEVVPFTSYAAGPGKVLMVEHTPDGIRSEGSDGEVTWVQDARGITLKDEPFWPKMAWLIDPQGALRLADYFGGLSRVSTRTIDGRAFYVVTPSELEPAHYELSFDAETGLLEGVGYYWTLSDYREIDGVAVPHRVTMSRKGGSTTYVFDLITHNLPLERTLFSCPTAF